MPTCNHFIEINPAAVLIMGFRRMRKQETIETTQDTIVLFLVREDDGSV